MLVGILSKYLFSIEDKIIAILVIGILNFSFNNLNLLNVFSFRIILINNSSTSLIYKSLPRIKIKAVKYRRIKIKETLISRYLYY